MLTYPYTTHSFVTSRWICRPPPPQQVDSQLLPVGSATGNSLRAVCVTPSSGLRIPSVSSTRGRTSSAARPFCFTRTFSGWWASSWTATPDCLSSSVRNATPSFTNATASWSGFCRGSTCRQLEKKTQRTSESVPKAPHCCYRGCFSSNILSHFQEKVPRILGKPRPKK